MKTTARPTILVVDDNPANLLAVEAALAPLALDVVKATSGDDALRCVLHQTFDLVILDVLMPGMDGFETAQRIRERDCDSEVPILFLTAFPLASGIVRGYAEGAAEYIEKPIDARLLRSTVTTLMSARDGPAGAHRTPRAGILVVDDNPSNLMAVGSALAALQEDVVTVTSGEAALQALEVRDYAVVLLDVVMPGADGFETARAIRNHPRVGGVPIILTSGIVRAADAVARGYAVGAVDFLFMPAEPDIIRSKVAVFVELYKKRLRAVRRLEALQEQLLLSDRLVSIGSLAAGIAHEINNPLAAVTTNLELVGQALSRCQEAVRRSAEADPSAEGQSACRAAVLSALADTGTMVADAREGAKRIGVITGDIKLFSRGDDVRMGPVDTHAVIESTARMCWNEIRPPGAPDQGLWGCACGTGL